MTGRTPPASRGEALIAAILREAGHLGQAKSEAERDAAIAAIQDAGQELKALHDERPVRGGAKPEGVGEGH